ncbi:hypothetical protein PSTT_00861, partial [Puccinia striiformis]
MVDNYNAVPKKPACDENVLFEREFQELNAELYTNTQGKGAHKKTLLSDPKILETLQAWTAKQKPG